MLSRDWIIECGQINNFMEFKDFYAISPENEKFHIKASRELYIAFDYYYNIWDDFNQFKILPSGGGTNDELPWYLDFIKYFNRINKQIENHLANRR